MNRAIVDKGLQTWRSRSYGAVKSTVVRAAASGISTSEITALRALRRRLADTFSRCTSWQGGARRARKSWRARALRARRGCAAAATQETLCKQHAPAGETHTYEADQDGDLNLQLTMVSFADAKAKKGETYVVYAAADDGTVARVSQTPWRNG